MRELRNSKKVSAMKVDTVKNIADMMAKCLSATVHERLVSEIFKCDCSRGSSQALRGDVSSYPIYFGIILGLE